MQTTLSIKQNIIDETDQCVLCGLCLPHCPTYSVAKNEAESPRGRISLVRALYEGKLQPNPTLSSHLDNCLTCLSCETVCPANVNYEKIIDAGREVTRHEHSFLYEFKQSLLLLVLTKAGIRKLVKTALKIYHYLNTDKLLKRLSTRLPATLRLLNLIPKPQKLTFPNPSLKNTVVKTRVALLNSCASDLFSDTTRASANYLLQALNCEIIEAKKTQCCGALHQHSGHFKTAQGLIQKFSASLSDEKFDALISMATGCGAQINRYPELLIDDVSVEFVAKHMDINAFALQQLKKHKLHFKPLAKKVFIHKPCTQNFANSNPSAVEQLLSEIPDLQPSVFQDELTCCGAGGINNLTQTKLVDSLIANKISELTTAQPAYLVTSNIGCAIHFQAQLQRCSSPITVCHPITLLAQQLLYSTDA